MVIRKRTFFTTTAVTMALGGIALAGFYASRGANARPEAHVHTVALSCAQQVHNWQHGAHVVRNVSRDAEMLGRDLVKLAGELSRGQDPVQLEANVSADAALLGTDASSAKSTPPPSCAAESRADFLLGMNDYQHSAASMQNGMTEFQTGSVTQAITDVTTANSFMSRGSSEMRAVAANFPG